MTTDAPSPKRIAVEQVDREAAFELADNLFHIAGAPASMRERMAYLCGDHDGVRFVQAFARHRIATTQASDAEIERLKRSRETVWDTLKKAEADFARAEAESARLREELAALRSA